MSDSRPVGITYWINFPLGLPSSISKKNMPAKTAAKRARNKIL